MESSINFLNSIGIETKSDGRQLINPCTNFDLDILYFGNKCINEDTLIVPHPGISKRLFALVPVVEIEPTFVDPATQLDVVSMCRRLYEQIREGAVEEQVVIRSEWDEDLPGVERGRHRRRVDRAALEGA